MDIKPFLNCLLLRSCIRPAIILTIPHCTPISPQNTGNIPHLMGKISYLGKLLTAMITTWINPNYSFLVRFNRQYHHLPFPPLGDAIPMLHFEKYNCQAILAIFRGQFLENQACLPKSDRLESI